MLLSYKGELEPPLRVFILQNVGPCNEHTHKEQIKHESKENKIRKTQDEGRRTC